ncbi:hypothetical protein GGI35DRAFT_463031 [Trichoderma velutinum]
MACPTPPSGDSGSPNSDEADPCSRTPPENFDLPLTPPRSHKRQAHVDRNVNEALDIFQKHQDQPSALAPRVSIELQSSQYYQLLEALEQTPSLNSYVEDKVQFGYDSEVEVLHIHMPSPVHDVFCGLIARDIDDQLRLISKNPGPAGKFASQIVNGVTSRIFFGVEGKARLQKQPDAQFQHSETQCPGVVIEVSVAQNGNDLDRLAWQYIQESDGDIKVVIGFDINTEGESTVSLWRAKIYREDGDEEDTLGVERVIQREPFRSPDNQAKEIQLDLKDFAPDKFYTSSERITLSITHGRVAEYYDTSVGIQKIREQPTGVEPKKKYKKQKRDESSSPKILSGDEDWFQGEENKAIDRSAVEDGDFIFRYRPRKKT